MVLSASRHLRPLTQRKRGGEFGPKAWFAVLLSDIGGKGVKDPTFAVVVGATLHGDDLGWSWVSDLGSPSSMVTIRGSFHWVVCQKWHEGAR